MQIILGGRSCAGGFHFGTSHGLRFSRLQGLAQSDLSVCPFIEVQSIGVGILRQTEAFWVLGSTVVDVTTSMVGGRHSRMTSMACPSPFSKYRLQTGDGSYEPSISNEVRCLIGQSTCYMPAGSYLVRHRQVNQPGLSIPDPPGSRIYHKTNENVGRMEI